MRMKTFVPKNTFRIIKMQGRKMWFTYDEGKTIAWTVITMRKVT
jgi:hypothetical protein